MGPIRLHFNRHGHEARKALVPANPGKSSGSARDFPHFSFYVRLSAE
jgi:hypothetical protein